MVQLRQVPAPEPTEIGSYFVSNYPPFSTWRPEHISCALEALDTPPPQRRIDLGAWQGWDVAAGESAKETGDGHAAGTTPPLGLYLHIPFCRKRCTFCYFRVYTDKNSADVDIYLDALARETALYAERAGLAGRQFEFVYFGGGTPSFLSPKQLQRLIDRINEHWTWSAAREVTFECEPGTLQKHKLKAIRDIGVTRLSLGVEHFDDELLERNGRAHKSQEIYRSYDWARDVGFPQINIDLIAGMVGETDDGWKRAVDKARALDPDSVTIYQMELPHNTVISREAKEHGGAPPVAGWDKKREWVDHGFRCFEAAGYQVSSAYTLVRPSSRSSFVYRDSLWHGADLVGMGVASFGQFAGVHMQNADGWDEYVSKLQCGDLPLARALRLTPRQALIRELILQMKTGRLDAGYFRRKFAVEILEEFGQAFESLVGERWAELDDDAVRLTRSGLLCVDTLLPRFFEPAHRDIRYT